MNPMTAAAKAEKSVRGDVARAVFFITTRAIFLLVAATASIYLLLSAIPFTYVNLMQDPLTPVAPWFGAHFRGLYWCAVAGVALELWWSGRVRERSAALFVASGAVFGSALLAWPPLSAVACDRFTLWWAVAAPFAAVWLGIVDAQRTEEVGRRGGGTKVMPMLLAAFLMTVALGRHEPGTSGAFFKGVAFVWCAAAAVFAVAAFELGRELISRAPRVWARCAMVSWATLCLALVIRRVGLSELQLTSVAAWSFAIMFSCAMVTSAMAMVERAREMQSARWWGALAGMAAMGLVIAFRHGIRQLDWNGMLHHLSALALLGAAMVVAAFAWRVRGEWTQQPLRKIAIVAAVAGLMTWAAPIAARQWPASPLGGALNDAAESNDLAGAFGRLFSPAFDNSDYSALFEELRRDANVQANATPVKLAGGEAVVADRPNIFIFVIDSLRRDYLSPYNAKVDFTPSIGEFARDSIVFQHAFTPYDGTAMSEPAIWSGALLPHDHAMTFAPVDGLEHLLDEQQYTKYVTLDTFLATALDKKNMHALNADEHSWEHYDLNQTLAELQGDLERDRKTPVFAFSQPQNVHMMGIYFAEKLRRPNRRYPGFDEERAFELERLDGGFGRFISFLKAKGLYENSIIVLTSDHGDSLGEHGRWGHGSTLQPEVIEVPLIIHVPQRLAKGLKWDTSELAFTTDITPTLYYLLGHRQIAHDEIYGKPLLTETDEERRSYLRDEYLITSSYGPAFGLLMDHGSKLFIASAFNDSISFYDLAADPTALHNRVSAAIVKKYAPRLEQRMDAVDKYYGVKR